MEATEEVIISKDQTQIVKGKRTKRVRPQSPSPLAKAEEDQFLGEDDNNTKNNSAAAAATTTASSTEFEDHNRIIIHNNNNSSSTEEEEDMANCLILLAQGQSRDSPELASEEDGNMMAMIMKPNNNINNYNYNNSSRKFMEASTIGGANRAGFYAYECKTCNRTFPSFQALGGHRASHKKPKSLSSPSLATSIIDKEKKKEQDFILHKNNNHSTLSFQLLNSSVNGNKNKNKVHECSVCGAEFASGQALGGHMRRHRAPIGTTTTTNNGMTTSLALNNNNPVGLGLEADHQYNNEDHHHQPRKKRNVLTLDLDLNLPAPEDDDDHQTDSSSFAFELKKQKQQQQQEASLVFSSAPALVDCHY